MSATAFTSQNSSLKVMSPVDNRWINQEHAQLGTQTLNRRAMDRALTFQAPEISPHPSIPGSETWDMYP
jgi:hypothetical protein